ncbi:MAG: Octanoyltransferase LipM [Chlamydiae bacterium]|nr:Octanoyltransferase LipM [Chlamydiota bacterium]
MTNLRINRRREKPIFESRSVYSQWNLLDTGTQSAESNMRLDAELLENLDQHTLPILHFYDWEGDSATYGYFINPSDYLNLEEAKKKGLNLAKRPTGGGIVFHIWDLAFSVLIPAGHPYFSDSTLDNYAFVNNAVLSAASSFLNEQPQLIPCNAEALDASCTSFCMAQPTKYDVVLQGKKIAGAAQRKTKKGFLHQGTIALKMPSEEYLKAVLRSETKVLEAIKAHTFPLLGPDDNLQEGRMALKEALQNQLTREQ